MVSNFDNSELARSVEKIEAYDKISIVLDIVLEDEAMKETPFLLIVNDTTFMYASIYDRDMDMVELVKSVHGKKVIVKVAMVEAKNVYDILLMDTYTMLDNNPNPPSDERSLYDRIREYLVESYLIEREI